MFNKKEKVEEKTMAEAIVELGKGMKELKEEIAEMKKQKVTEPVKPEVTEEVKKPVTKKEEPVFIIYDQPVKTKRIIINNTDKENPEVYDIESALAKILNEIEVLKKRI